MDVIVDFYKELDTLNLIIFWGIIIVIVLLIIFSFILINKNKKLKKIVEEKNKTEEDLPIIKEDLIKEENNEEIILPISEEINNSISTTEEENNFVSKAESSNHNKQLENHVEKSSDEFKSSEEPKYDNKQKQPFEIPTKPYQRNVLREMSLSQTSPIGINRQVPKEDKNMEMIKDLEESLNNNDVNLETQPTTEIEPLVRVTSDNLIKEEIKENDYFNQRQPEYSGIKEDSALELLNNQETINDYQPEQNESEKYLEEVSRKLAEAEIPEEIERTNYELQQEEDAIISYKELMEKKDTIQTIDEEEAVISIEELMNRTQQKQEEDSKLYNLSEDEANDNFIKELKQFRNDL